MNFTPGKLELSNSELKYIRNLTTLSSNFNNMDNKDFVQTMNHNMALLSDWFGIDRIILYSLDPDINFSLFEFKKEKYPSHLHLTKNDFPKMFPWLLAELSKNSTINFEQIKHLPEQAKSEKLFYEKEGVTSIVWIPIFFRNKLFAFLEFTYFSASHSWNTFSNDFYQIIANLFMVPLERKKNEEKIDILYTTLDQKINEKDNELTTLLNIQKALTSELHIDHVIQLIADEAKRLTNTRLSTVCLLENGKLILRVASGDFYEELPIGYEIPLDPSFLELALESDFPLFFDDPESISGIFCEALKLTKAKSVLIIPLKSGRKTIGILTVSDKEKGILGYPDARLLKMFANIAIIALENARIYKQEQRRREEAENGKKDRRSTARYPQGSEFKNGVR